MTKMFKDKRVTFPPGKQREFLEQVGKLLKTADIARISHCSERTIRDWRREKFSIPLSVIHMLSTQAHIPVPKNIKIRNAYAHTSKAGKMGIAAVTEKYGRIPRNEKYRKEQWELWWESTGKLEKSPLFESKAVYKPRQDTNLAEFIGIMMGDGGISEYQVVITLHHIDDLEYSVFVTKMIKRLFKILPRIYHSPRKSVNSIVVSRKELVQYLHTMGLPIGNKIKQQFDIPAWIKRDRKFAMACVRGLIDTDGTIFTHRYKSKEKWYAYKKLSFTSASEPLRKSIYALLCVFGLNPRMTSDDVRLDRVEDMKKYFSLIGSHNPKHLRRYKNTVE
ncbi:hypothetical protein EXS57_02680 [Candidatus Kaiserbacteria bacterium]|nr:hypothetical protein [Candidatus Kaiserbacteria bacterium]